MSDRFSLSSWRYGARIAILWRLSRILRLPIWFEQWPEEAAAPEQGGNDDE